MATATDLELSITANVNGLTAGMTQAQAAVRSAAQAMRTDLGGGLRGATDASASFESRVRALKSEMVAGDRTINFFARSLNGIVPEASAAGQGIRLLADGLIGGLGLGLALQGVMAVISLFGESLKESSEKEREAAEASKKYAAERLKAYQDADREFSKLQFIRAGGTAEGFAASEKDQAAALRVMGAEDALGQARDSFRARWADTVPEEGTMHAKEYADELERIRSLEAELASARGAAGKTVAAGVSGVDEKTHADWRKEFDAQVRDTEAALAKQDAAKKKSAAEEETRRAARAKLESDLLRERLDAEQVIDQFVAETGERQRKRAEELADWWKKFNAEVADVERGLARESAENVKRTIEPLVSTWTKGIASIVTGAQSAAEAVRGIAASMIQLAFDVLAQTLTTTLVAKATKKAAAISEVTANAGIAGSGAAASQAAIPIIGPALAAAAMASTTAQVLGAMLPLASASRGFDIPAGINPVTQLHQREMVLPADIADPLRKSIRGGGGVGGGITVVNNVSALDGRSAERVLVDQNGAVQRSMRRVERRVAR